MIYKYLVVACVCFAGAVLQSVVGFGFPIIALIFFSMLFPIPLAVTITQTAGVVGVTYFFIRYFRHIKWKILLPFLISSLIVGIPLTWYSGHMSAGNIKIHMGVVLVLIASFMLFFQNRVTIKPNTVTGCVTGAVSGAMNGLFAIGGPPVALYLYPSINDKIAYIASVNAYFVIFKLFSLPIRLSQGNIASESVGYLFTAIVSMTAGTLMGEHFMKKVQSRLLTKLVYGFVLVSGLIIVVQELLK